MAGRLGRRSHFFTLAAMAAFASSKEYSLLAALPTGVLATA
jgi:hypothetical protein